MERERITIIGAGINGLVTANYVLGHYFTSERTKLYLPMTSSPSS